MATSQVNKHGLERYIDPRIKRIIRQQCGFGCCICGNALINYEHVDPEFAEATIHDPNKMTLLCYEHHGYVTKGLWSKEKIKAAMKDPAALKKGFSNGMFDFNEESPTIIIGGNSLNNCIIPFQIQNQPSLIIKPPEQKGQPFEVSGNFYDQDGENTLWIVGNEFHTSSLNWDVDIVGSRIVIREKLGKIHLQILLEPPTKLIIEKYETIYNNYRYIVTPSEITKIAPNGQKGIMSGNSVSDGPIGIRM